MAQATNYVFNYIAGMSIKAGTVKTSAEILTAYPTAKAIIMLTDNVKVSINATDAVTFMRDDHAAVVTGATWVFNNDCEVAIAVVVNVVA